MGELIFVNHHMFSQAREIGVSWRIFLTKRFRSPSSLIKSSMAGALKRKFQETGRLVDARFGKQHLILKKQVDSWGLHQALVGFLYTIYT